MTICLLDPGLGDHKGSPSLNLGDLIIQEAVLQQINSTFGDQDIVRISSHTALEKEHFKQIQTASTILVGGTNLLSSNMNRYNQWKIFLQDAFRIKNAILLGVGWWKYQEKPNFYTQILLKAALSRKAIHSVRDGYTEEQLKSIGIKNVINTGCPTMWSFADMRQEEIARHRAENALVMLTDYSKRPELDRELLKLVTSQYKQVYAWPQGPGDRQYISDMDLPITLLERSFSALQAFVTSDIEFDYIGTRLHGGIKCLQSKRRSLILKIDNRATEIAKETGLPSCERADLEYVRHWIENPSPTNIRVNVAAISQWKGQFLNQSSLEISAPNAA